jgi:hypothetical protein
MTAIPAAPKRPSLRGQSVGPFSLITLIVVIVIGLAAFVTATYLETFGDGGGEPRTTGANSFSRSAIGHRAFVAALRKLDIPVQISRFRSFDKAGSGSLLLIIEPDPGEVPQAHLEKLRTLPHALLVLPKWVGWTDRDKPIWVNRMDLLSTSVPEKILKEVLSDGAVQRSDAAVTQQTQLGGKLKLDHPQTITSNDLTPLVAIGDNILLGSVGNLWILADPDLLSNAGIDDAGNGVIAISVIDSLLPKGGTVIVDETLHGFEQRPNLMRTLLRSPFVTILIALIVAMLVLVWAGATRFGAPQAEANGLAAGKLTLVKSAAKLLRFGTSANNLLLSYRRLVLADAMNELHGPNGLDEHAQAAWLDRAAAHRGLNLRLGPMLDEMSALAESGRIDATRALRFAHELFRWKQEILHGTVIATRGRRRTGRSVTPSGIAADGAQGRR